jgi:2-succinyl-6-hydroxy-2,4-cyclohexadiene-1-carboxylate synthase
MPVANINGVNLNYEVAGQGQAVVFLHGMTGSTRDWVNQISVLSPKYRVVALDMRGHGKSAAPTTEAGYSIPIFAEDVLGLLNLLGIRKCCLAGHSIGGFIALQFALSHADRLAGLVLVDTSSGQFGMDPNYAKLRQKLDELANSKGTEAAFDYDASNNPMRIERFQKHPELREVSRQKVKMTSVAGYIYGPRAIGKWQPVTPRLSEIRVPTLIYWGDEDTAFTEPVKILNKGIAGSILVTVQGVGHNPHEEAPEIFDQAVLKFLERVEW